MNREIKFRALTQIENFWVYGYLFKDEYGEWYIQDCNNISIKHPIKIETAGQFINLHDKNEKEIYEGDIVELEGTRGARGWIRYEEQRTAYVVEFGNIESGGDYQDLNHFIVKVIDNIHENSELLEKSKEMKK